MDEKSVFTLEDWEIRDRVRDTHLDARGREILDPVPVAPPLGYKREKSMFDHVRELVRSEHVRLAALAEGKETFEESDDFDVDDDMDIETPYEENFDPVEEEVRIRLRQQDYDNKVRARLEEMQPPRPEPVRGKKDARSVENDEGGSGDTGERTGLSDKVGEVDPKPKRDASDAGSRK